MPNISLGNVRYNASAGAFEARVDVEACGQTYRYPCQVAGPVTMDMNDVRQRLTRSAMRMSDSGAPLWSRL